MISGRTDIPDHVSFGAGHASGSLDRARIAVMEIAYQTREGPWSELDRYDGVDPFDMETNVAVRWRHDPTGRIVTVETRASRPILLLEFDAVGTDDGLPPAGGAILRLVRRPDATDDAPGAAILEAAEILHAVTVRINAPASGPLPDEWARGVSGHATHATGRDAAYVVMPTPFRPDGVVVMDRDMTDVELAGSDRPGDALPTVLHVCATTGTERRPDVHVLAHQWTRTEDEARDDPIGEMRAIALVRGAMAARDARRAA